MPVDAHGLAMGLLPRRGGWANWALPVPSEYGTDATPLLAGCGTRADRPGGQEGQKGGRCETRRDETSRLALRRFCKEGTAAASGQQQRRTGLEGAAGTPVLGNGCPKWPLRGCLQCQSASACEAAT